MSYRLALLSPILCVRRASNTLTLDLWQRDLTAQLEVVDELLLLAPVAAEAPADGVVRLALPDGLRVVDPARITEAELRELLSGVDAVQLPGNDDWRGAALARRVRRAALAVGRPIVLGISSNRARTALLNSRGRGPLARLRALWRAASVTTSQSWLARRADGVFVVGEGLRAKSERWNENVHVGTASWIRREDLVDADARGPAWPQRTNGRLALGVAARLEPMKGVHLALEALHHLRVCEPTTAQREHLLEIAGQGAEEAALRRQAQQLGIDHCVSFIGTLAYPDAFFAWLRNRDLVLLTNLNDEQPRLVFDAIAQGVVPVCPDSVPYRGLGLPTAVLYARGDAGALADRIAALTSDGARASLTAPLRALALAATIETMHARRAEWISRTVLRQQARPRSD